MLYNNIAIIHQTVILGTILEFLLVIHETVKN
jgi:hypothetical protein